MSSFFIFYSSLRMEAKNTMEGQDQATIPFFISLEAIKDALKTLPIEEIRAVKEIIDEIVEEYEKENADR